MDAVIALCNSDSPLRGVDIAVRSVACVVVLCGLLAVFQIPTNNKSRHSISLVYWCEMRMRLHCLSDAPLHPLWYFSHLPLSGFFAARFCDYEVITS